MDNTTVYCIEPGVDITTHLYNGAVGWVNSPYSSEVNRKIQLIGYYGYEYPGHHTLRYRMAAQALIWETTGGQIVEFWTEASGWGDYINIDYEKNEIMKLVNTHYQVPSFNNEYKTGVIGKDITFTDTTGVLSNYQIYNSNGATSSINGNTLTVVPNKVGEITVSLVRKSYTNNPTTIFVGIDERSQKMAYFGLDDPVVASVKMNVLGGRIEIVKTDVDTGTTTPSGEASLIGAVYGVYDLNDNLITTLTTDNNSYAISDYLPDLNVYYLKGVNLRLVADSFKDDLVKFESVDEENKQFEERIKPNIDLNRDDYFYIPGKILHIDSDLDYLNRCLDYYKEANIWAMGINETEENVPLYIREWLEEYNPNIIVITGHDAYYKKKGSQNNISAYKNSNNFVKAIKEARKFEKSHDKLIIIAGANFASSPKRVNIHALDPAIIATKMSLSDVRKDIDLKDIIENTKYGKNGIGGVITKGTMYTGYPR